MSEKMNNEKKYNQPQSAKASPSGRFGGALFLLLLFSFSAFAQQENTDIRTGNRLYEQGKFVEAEIAFRRALDINPESFEAHFNLGNALIRQGRYHDALEYYIDARTLLSSENESDRERLASVYHNMGSALLINGLNILPFREWANLMIEGSIEAFKNSLRINPLSDETRFNLAFAQSLLQRDEDEQDDDGGGGGGGDGGQDDDQQQEPPPPPQQQPQPVEPLMSPESARQILNALLEDEREVQERVRQQQQPRRRDLERDW